MMTEFLADLQQGESHESIRALKRLRDKGLALAPVETITRLVDRRLAWVGPPPAQEVCISYRGRKALRDADQIAAARARFASALRLCRSRG